jgi:metal-sulfur cluster biosynthetic enzyme
MAEIPPLETIEDVKEYVIQKIRFHYTELYIIQNGTFEYKDFKDVETSAKYHQCMVSAFISMAVRMKIHEEAKEVSKEVDVVFD